MRGGLGDGYKDVDWIWNFDVVIWICKLWFLFNKYQGIEKVQLVLIQSVIKSSTPRSVSRPHGIFFY